MSTIKLPAPASKDEIRAVLHRSCPDLDLSNLGVMVLATRSRWVGAAVNAHRNKVSVMPMVGSLPMFLLVFLMGLTGIGVVIYAVTALPKQMRLVERVTAVLQRELAAPARDIVAT